MGYRSQVKALIETHKKSAEEVAQDIKDIMTKCGDNVFDRVETKDNLVLCEAEWIKWYDTFEVVESIENYFDDLEENFDCNIHFVRIGEDIEDVEERFYGDVEYYLGINRYIDDGDF